MRSGIGAFREDDVAVRFWLRMAADCELKAVRRCDCDGGQLGVLERADQLERL